MSARASAAVSHEGQRRDDDAVRRGRGGAIAAELIEAEEGIPKA